MAIPEAGWHSFLPEIRVGFHGSRKQFNKFSLNYFGQSDAGQWGEGIYFSDKEEIASQWGNYLYRCNLHFYSPFIVESGDMGRLNDFLNLGSTTKECTDKLKELGYDSIISEGETWYVDGKTIKGNQYVIFDPKNIEILTITDLNDGGQPMNEAFETHDKLNPRLFDNNTKKMRKEVRERLIEIADKFVDGLKEDGVPLKVYDYWVLGSNAAYNYTPKSDIDTHIIVNMEDVDVAPEVLTILYNYAKSKFNDDYDITIRGQEVELYIEDINTSAISNGVYSLKRDKWIKEPEPMKESSIDITNEDEYKEWDDRFEQIINSDNIDDLQSFVDDIYVLRKDSLAKDGEFGLGNLIFKEMRNQDKLQQIKDRIKEVESKELTLESLKESAGNEDYYRFTIKDKNGQDTGMFFSALNNGVLKPYAEKENEIPFFILDLNDLAESTPYPEEDEGVNIPKSTLFAYKQSFVNKNKQLFDFLKQDLEAYGFGLITTKFKRPDNIVYEDKTQIGYLPNTQEKLPEAVERTVYNAWHAWPQYRHKYGRVDSFFELQRNFHLTNEEMKWILKKCLEKGLIDDYTESYVIDYLKLDEGISKNIKEELNEDIENGSKDIFDINHISIPYYDELLKSQSFRDRENKKIEIVQMSPREYFRGCAKVFDSTFDKQIRQVKEDKETLDYIQSEIDKGHKLPLTWLDYSAEKSQDGRHRMYVVGNAFGWDEKYPVAVFTTLDEEEAEKRTKAKEEERITKYFYWIENKLLGYSYRDLDELKEQVEYLLHDYLDDEPKVKVDQRDKNTIITVNGVEFTYNTDDFEWETEAKSLFDDDEFGYEELEENLNENVDKTGDTVIKAVLYHWEEKPLKTIPDFEDFEKDGVYKLGNNDYIAFEKRWRDDPRGWGLIHQDIVDNLVEPLYHHYDKWNNYIGIEVDNMGQSRNTMYDDVKDEKLKEFAKYGSTMRKAIRNYFD